MGQKNIIELNGKTYDATTGALLGQSRIKAVPPANSVSSQRGRTIDGFVRAPQHSTPHASVPHVVTSLASASPKSTQASVKKHFDIQRKQAHALKAHQPQKPQTLMRHVVKKPQVDIKPAIKTTMPSEMMAKPKSDLAKPLEKKMSVTQVNPIRLAHSRRIAKSQHIHRFSKERPTTVAPKQAIIPVAQQSVTPTRRSDYGSRPVIVRQQAQRPHAHVATYSSTQQAATTRPVAAQPQSNAISATDIFEAALAHATSHEQKTPPHARRHTAARRRMVNIFAGVGAFLLIAGFVGYLNMTNIELRVASMRAGIHASMPAYKPTGFAMDGGIESSEGRVAMNFRSGESIYTITQEASDWNSTTLLDQTISERGQPTQTVQSKGRTIYIFDKSNATWVNGGVRYQVSGNASLDTSELVELATSM
ncbi:MAG TPA: DUF4367 domain-containing protein [Candidatus Saccharimonadales bacterium]